MASARMILLAEEDPATAGFLADNLDRRRLPRARRRRQDRRARAARRPSGPTSCVCDVNGDTLDLLDAVRGADGLASRIAPDTPLIVLTAHADELARVRYFDRGGDDVIAKPFSYPELRARIRALLRRALRAPRSARLRVGALTIDPASRAGARRRDAGRAGPEGVRAAARARRASRRACSPSTSCCATSGASAATARTRTLDSHACRLRAKLSAAGDRRWIENVWGVGYRLVGVDPDARDGSAA